MSGEWTAHGSRTIAEAIVPTVLQGEVGLSTALPDDGIAGDYQTFPCTVDREGEPSWCPAMQRGRCTRRAGTGSTSSTTAACSCNGTLATTVATYMRGTLSRTVDGGWSSNRDETTKEATHERTSVPAYAARGGYHQCRGGA